MEKTTKKLAYSLGEALIVMVLVGIVYTVIASLSKPTSIKADALKKAGMNMTTQIDFATRQILAKSSYNYTLLNIRATDGSTFSIASSGNEAKLANVYKKYLVAKRGKTLSSTYTSMTLKNEAGTSLGITPSSFTGGYFLKNDAYFALKMNGNCTTTISYVYTPFSPTNHSVTNSCAQIFFDVNGQDDPNTVGIDQYILSIGKLGLK